jgi:hypothetical protein
MKPYQIAPGTTVDRAPSLSGALVHRLDKPYQCRQGAKCRIGAKPLKLRGVGFAVPRQTMIRMARRNKNPNDIRRLDCHSKRGSSKV